VTLTQGTRIGSYELGAQIGAGGMGEVYRATDTNLKRQVAIKVLPAAVAGDAERLARFQREAEVLAALNHPNIAQIHGLERGVGTTALVMELVEGPTLADRIAQGPIPVDESLPIARQIADALEAAHEQGIVHRDLKPANVKLRPDGSVKVLDFGLAKALEPGGSLSSSLSLSPTITTPAMTQAGLVLGTAAYMSPEQAKGRPADTRADIWAFGAVLFEMLTGTRAFDAEDVPETFVAVLRAEVDWDRLPPDLPPRVVVTIRRCLQKDLRQRAQAIGDVRLALEGAFETPAPAASDAATVAIRAVPPWRRALPVALAVVVAGLLVDAAWRFWPSPPAEVNRFAYRPPDSTAFRREGRPVLAVSPDGRHFAYNTGDGLYLRAMGEIEARIVAGTGPDLAGPFFSHDGQQLAYFDFGAGEIKRIGISGGAPVTVADVENNLWGAHWAGDGTILFGQLAGVMRVPASGGTPSLAIEAAEGERLYGPRMLPDGEHVLFAAATATGATRWDEAQIVVASLATGERTVVVQGGSEARYLPTGHLLYALGDDVLAVPFDLGSLTTRGGAAPLLQGVSRGANPATNTGVANYDVAGDGTLVYLTGRAAEGGTGLFWADGSGLAPLFPEGRDYEGVRLSPDGRHLATVETDGEGSQVWVVEIESGTRRQLTTDETYKNEPVWTPDGERVTFRAGDDIVWQRADGSEPAEVLVDRDDSVFPTDWSPDGQTLAFVELAGGQPDLWTYSVADGEARPFLVGPGAQLAARFSTDGDWVAFDQRSESGRAVWVAPFPAGRGAATQVSGPDTPGDFPSWSHDGQRLYYRGFDGGANGIFVSRVQTGGELRRSAPELLLRPASGFGFAGEHPDGERFLVVTARLEATAGDDDAAEFVIVQHLFDELRRLASTE